MNRIKALGALLVIVVVVSLVGVSCASAPTATPTSPPPTLGPIPATPTPTPIPGGTIIYASFADAKNLNPILYTDITSGVIIGRVFDSLLDIDPETGEPIPALAESWEVSEDARTYTFHLRKDVKWHDGEPFTSEDVLFTFQAITSPDVKTTAHKSDFDGVEQWLAPDDYTFTVVYTDPYCPALYDLGGYGIIPAHAFPDGFADVDKSDFNTKNPIGTGPFMFKEWVKDDHITLVKNPNYWGGTPHIDAFIYKVVPDAKVLAAQLKTGEVDVGGIEAKDLADMEKVEMVNVYKYAAMGYTYIGINQADPKDPQPVGENKPHPILSYKRVRQALVYGLDRQAIIDMILFGQGEIMHSNLPPISWAHKENLKVMEYNPDKARELLAEAGWKDTDGDGILDKDGEPLRLNMHTNAGNKVREAVVTIAQQQYKELGIDIVPNLIEWNAYLDVLEGQKCDLCVIGWSLGLDPDQKSIWHSSADQLGSVFNFISYINPELDKLIEEGITTPGCDVQKRKEIYGQMEQILAEDVPCVFLYMGRNLVAVNKRVQGPDPSPFAGSWWNLEDWYITR